MLPDRTTTEDFLQNAQFTADEKRLIFKGLLARLLIRQDFLYKQKQALLVGSILAVIVTFLLSITKVGGNTFINPLWSIPPAAVLIWFDIRDIVTSGRTIHWSEKDAKLLDNMGFHWWDIDWSGRHARFVDATIEEIERGLSLLA